MYVFQLFDNYSASGSALLWIALFQSIAIGWIYGKKIIVATRSEDGGSVYTPELTKVVFIKTFGHRVCFDQPSKGVLTSNECYDKLGGSAIPQSTFPSITCAFPIVSVSCMNRPNFIGFPIGGERFYDDMENMIGFRINPWLRWCWMIFTPIFCLVRQNIYLSVSELFSVSLRDVIERGKSSDFIR